MSYKAARDRASLIETHVIHEFDRMLAIDNLLGTYGQVMRVRYARMLAHLRGKRILDVGCGCGLFTRVCLDAGYDVFPIDLDEELLALARSLFRVEGRTLSVYETGLPTNSIDTIVMLDVIEHLELPRLLYECKRLGASLILLYTSNLGNPILRLYRHVTGHKEFAEVSAQQILSAFRQAGFRVKVDQYDNVLELPLTGGLQRKPLPVVGRSVRAVETLNAAAELITAALGLAKWFAWRRLFVFEKESANAAEERKT